MSQFEELINKLCPDGVEYKTIGEIATDLFRGSGIKKNETTSEGIPCVRYGEIYTSYGIWFDKCISHTKLEYVTSPKWFEYGDILFAITGEKVEDIAKSTAYIGNKKGLAGGDVVVLKHNQDPKYLSYALSTDEARVQKSAGKVKSKVVHSSIPAIKAIKIPVPPLEVQREIVRILDNFTEITEEITEELTEELTARKQQYEYYRNKLFKIESGEIKSLGEICKFKYGEGNTIPETTGKYPVYGCNGIIGHTDRYNNENTPIIGHIGSAGIVNWASGKNFVTYNGTICKANESIVQPRYLYYLLTQLNLTKYVKGNQPFLSYGDISKIKTKIPSLEEQERTVIILDYFDSICSDFNTGLPAEIEARQKQYAYYRDKLLTFKRKTA